MRIKKISKLLILTTLLSLQIGISSKANAAVVTATGTNPSYCDQTVGNATNVVAYRNSAGDCVIEFKNVGTTSWTPNAGVTSVRVLVVGGGGGGASRHAGGGGAGGVVDATSYSVAGTIGITVGNGGNGGVSAIYGTSGSDSRFFSNSEATLGSTGIVAKGGGFGDYYQWSSPNKFIGRAGDGGSGGGSAVSNPFTRDLGAAPWGNTDPRGYTIQSSQTQKRIDGTTLSSNFNQYGNDGAGGGNQDYWAGGGGGGAGAAGARGGGAAGTSRIGGNGGNGVQINIRGTNDYFGGGGGGGGGGFTLPNPAAGSGGAGGGGAGSVGNATATNGTANTGGGGGGGGVTYDGRNGQGGSGGSGIVIVRYTPIPAITSSVTISGTTTYPQTLTAGNGSWDNSPTSYTYQWSRATTAIGAYSSIAGATSSTYSLISDDVGKFLKVAVTAINSGGSTTETSSATTAISAATSSTSVSIAVGTLTFRTTKAISATPTVAGKLTFRANNVIIPGCKNLVAQANTAKSCNYRPNSRGYVTISVRLVPTDTGYSISLTNSDRLFVYQRSGRR